MYAATGGYPYFIQAYGKAVWDVAPRIARSPPTTSPWPRPRPRAELAVGFFGSRYERATPGEREYLRAMADGSPVGRGSADEMAGAHRRRRGRTWPASPSRCRRRATRCSRRA